ncbi:helix-turn-helix domain-containing protein [Streptomyces sp. NPDC002574]|uniref:helix-turn-helix domain-containing protein n=1 Tax=Streptomyces sp. NPDC002574 TaxID=3364652 RepID=UPI003675660D
MTGDEDWMTAQEAALFAGVHIQTLRSWVRRGHLEPGGLNAQGRYLFRLGDVARAEAATRSKGMTRASATRSLAIAA